MENSTDTKPSESRCSRSSTGSDMPKQKVLDAAEEAVMAAGFCTNSAGPINWRCAASRGSYQSPLHFGYPLRWDLVLKDIQEDWPELFQNKHVAETAK